MYFVTAQALTRVAYEFYTDVVVVSVDVSDYSYWSSLFVPKNYGALVYGNKHAAARSFDRFCVVDRVSTASTMPSKFHQYYAYIYVAVNWQSFCFDLICF